jgi:hypothetical protein
LAVPGSQSARKPRNPQGSLPTWVFFAFANDEFCRGIPTAGGILDQVVVRSAQILNESLTGITV